MASPSSTTQTRPTKRCQLLLQCSSTLNELRAKHPSRSQLVLEVTSSQFLLFSSLKTSSDAGGSTSRCTRRGAVRWPGASAAYRGVCARRHGSCSSLLPSYIVGRGNC